MPFQPRFLNSYSITQVVAVATVVVSVTVGVGAVVVEGVTPAQRQALE